MKNADVIFTRYHGPTNCKGSRISAYIPHRKARVTVPLDYALDIVGRHEVAAQALVAKIGWPPRSLILAGESPDQAGFLFVHMHGDA